MTQKCPLLRLPTELRVIIYETVTASSPEYPIYVHRVSEEHAVGNYAALARVSRQIRSEYLATHQQHAHIALPYSDVEDWFRDSLRSMLPADASKCVLHLQISIPQMLGPHERPMDILPMLRYKELLRRYTLQYPTNPAVPPSCRFVFAPLNPAYRAQMSGFEAWQRQRPKPLVDHLNRLAAIQEGSWLALLREGSPLARVVLRLEPYPARVSLVLRSRKGLQDRKLLNGWRLRFGTMGYTKSVESMRLVEIEAQTTRSYDEACRLGGGVEDSYYSDDSAEDVGSWRDSYDSEDSAEDAGSRSDSYYPDDSAEDARSYSDAYRSDDSAEHRDGDWGGGAL